MQEVVKKEIINLLDVGVTYPISNSSLICPVQCVPKKGGITVVPNERNEIFIMRPVIGVMPRIFFLYVVRIVI